VASRLTRFEPESVLVTGPRRLVTGLSSVSTVSQTVTVGDSGVFLIPLDVKRLGPKVTVRPAEIRLSVTTPPLARIARDSAATPR
jgi:hypothetical protein